MRSAWLTGPRDIALREVSEPEVIEEGDAVVDVLYAGICGSDLWSYRGILPKTGSTGHEFIGRVREVGADVTTLRPGDAVIAPFMFSEGSCDECTRGLQPLCADAGLWGKDGPGAQADAIRVPFADATLVRLPWDAAELDDDLARRLVPLADVFATGTHGAVLAGVGPDDTVAVVGDGAVGISAAIAARRLGAARVILFGEQPGRLAVAARFDIETVEVAGGESSAERMRELNRGRLADRVVECVGMQSAFESALGLVRPAGSLGFVGVPHGVDPIAPKRLFDGAVRLAGGVAPARHYLPTFVAETAAGDLDVSPLVDRVHPLEEVATAYREMDSGDALKVALRVRQV